MPPGMIFTIPTFEVISEKSLVKIALTLLCDNNKETTINVYAVLKKGDIVINDEGLPRLVTFNELYNYCDLDSDPDCVKDYFRK